MDDRTILADSRTMSDNDALACHGRIATLTARLRVAEAKAKKRIVAIKCELEEEAAPLLVELQAEEKRLLGYIDGHPDRFQDPRAQVTSFGSFGMRRVSNLEVADEDGLIKRLVKLGWDDCLKTKYSLIKAGIKKRLKAGGKVRGASIVSGERAFVEVAKDVVVTALKDAGLELADEDGGEPEE